MSKQLDELIEQLRELSEEDQAATASVVYTYLAGEERQGVHDESDR